MGGDRDVLQLHARRRREPVCDRAARRSTAPGSSRASRTPTWSPTRRCSTSATSACRSRSPSPPARCSRARPTSAGSSRPGAGRSPPGRSSASASCSAPTGPTSRSAGAATTRWDPVENAALMPWLAATAFLHSVMIQERKGMLRVWNMVLVAFAFELSLFGTFLTRSGVVNSIHSFAKSSIGGWFLGIVDRHDALLARADPLAAAAAARADEARVGALARGGLPLQQPAPRRALPDASSGARSSRSSRSSSRAYQRTMGRPLLRLLPARSSGCRCCC